MDDEEYIVTILNTKPVLNPKSLRTLGVESVSYMLDHVYGRLTPRVRSCDTRTMQFVWYAVGILGVPRDEDWDNTEKSLCIITECKHNAECCKTAALEAVRALFTDTHSS